MQVTQLYRLHGRLNRDNMLHMAQLAGQPFFEGSLYLDGNLEVEAVEAPERRTPLQLISSSFF